MVRESRKNAAGPAGGRLPARAPPFGGIRRGVSTNPPRTHQHFFLVRLGWVFFFFCCCSFSVCSADLPFGGRGDRAGALRRVRAAAAPSGPRRAPCPCHEARGCRQERLEKTGLVQELEAPRVLCSQSEYVTLPRASVSPPEAGALPLRGVFGLERGKAKPSCCSGRPRRMAL